MASSHKFLFFYLGFTCLSSALGKRLHYCLTLTALVVLVLGNGGTRPFVFATFLHTEGETKHQIWTSLGKFSPGVRNPCECRCCVQQEGMLTLLMSLLQRCGCARRSAGSWATPTSAGCHRCPLPPLTTEATCSSLRRSSIHPSSTCISSIIRASRRMPRQLMPMRRRRVFQHLGRTARARRNQGIPAPPPSSPKWAASSSACCLPRWTPTQSAMRWIAPTRWSAGRDICQPRL